MPGVLGGKSKTEGGVGGVGVVAVDEGQEATTPSQFSHAISAQATAPIRLEVKVKSAACDEGTSTSRLAVVGQTALIEGSKAAENRASEVHRASVCKHKPRRPLAASAVVGTFPMAAETVVVVAAGVVSLITPMSESSLVVISNAGRTAPGSCWIVARSLMGAVRLVEG